MTTSKEYKTATGVAKLTNVGVALAAMKQIQNATAQMPRMAVLSGPPGYGKSQSAAFMAHPAGGNAAYVSLRMFDTTKTMAHLIATELEVRWKDNWPVARLFDGICERMSVMDRVLVIDEVDHVAEKSSIDFIRAIHDQASAPIFLIGEEQLQNKLLRHHERFHDRVLVWAEAQPCDADDVALLCKHYAPELTWEPDAYKAMVARTHGVARRVTTEVERLKEECRRLGQTAVTALMVVAAKGRV